MKSLKIENYKTLMKENELVHWEDPEGLGGGGIGMGNTCKSMAESFQCMAKPTTILESN